MFPDAPGATEATVDVPLPIRTLLAGSVARPVPPDVTPSAVVSVVAPVTASVLLRIAAPVIVVAPVSPVVPVTAKLLGIVTSPADVTEMGNSCTLPAPDVSRPRTLPAAAVNTCSWFQLDGWTSVTSRLSVLADAKVCLRLIVIPSFLQAASQAYRPYLALVAVEAFLRSFQAAHAFQVIR